MSSSRKHLQRRVFLLGTLALSGCGFRPVFQRGTASDFANLQGKVALPNANNREQYVIRNQLESYFGNASAPVYELSITYRSTVANLAISQNSVVTRKRVTANGRYKAVDLRTSQTVLDLPFHHVASYSANSDRFAADENLAATKDALAREVASDFALKFIAALAQGEQI